MFEVAIEFAYPDTYNVLSLSTNFRIIHSGTIVLIMGSLRFNTQTKVPLKKLSSAPTAQKTRKLKLARRYRSLILELAKNL